jgi:hypothetical protein
MLIIAGMAAELPMMIPTVCPAVDKRNGECEVMADVCLVVCLARFAVRLGSAGGREGPGC